MLLKFGALIPKCVPSFKLKQVNVSKFGKQDNMFESNPFIFNRFSLFSLFNVGY